VSYVAGSKRNG